MPSTLSRMKYQAIYQCGYLSSIVFGFGGVPFHVAVSCPGLKPPSLFESPSCSHCPSTAVGAFPVVLVTSLYVSRLLDSLWSGSQLWTVPLPPAVLFLRQLPLGTATPPPHCWALCAAVTLLPKQLPGPPHLSPRGWVVFLLSFSS